MADLVEILSVNQASGEPRRRWFTSEELDLIVWCDEVGDPAAFQLCYDKERSERALTWSPDHGFTHRVVDDGERVGGKHKAIPILVADVLPFAANRVTRQFAAASGQVPPEVAKFVKLKLQEHPDYVHEA